MPGRTNNMLVLIKGQHTKATRARTRARAHTHTHTPYDGERGGCTSTHTAGACLYPKERDSLTVSSCADCLMLTRGAAEMFMRSGSNVCMLHAPKYAPVRRTYPLPPPPWNKCRFARHTCSSAKALHRPPKAWSLDPRCLRLGPMPIAPGSH